MKNLYAEEKDTFSQNELNAVLSDHERYVSYKGGKRAQLAHARLDGLNLANRTLSEADFSGCTLVGATLYGSNLERASFYCADLRGCNLQMCNLARADMRGASLKGANLSFAVLDAADLRAAMMMYVGASDVSVIDHNEHRDNGRTAKAARTDGGVDFSNCSLKHASFGSAKLDRANFSGALLDGAKFKGARLENVVFKGAVLTGVEMTDLHVPPEALDGCLMDVTAQALEKSGMLKAKLDAHQRWIATGGKDGAQGILDGEDLRPLRDSLASRPLSGLCVRGATAVGMNFSSSQLQAAKFDGADLRDADFSGADLRGVSFKGAKLAHAKFENANLCALPLTKGGSIKPDFTEVQATIEQFMGASLDEPLADLGLQLNTY